MSTENAPTEERDLATVTRAKEAHEKAMRLLELSQALRQQSQVLIRESRKFRQAGKQPNPLKQLFEPTETKPKRRSNQVNSDFSD